MFHPTLDRRSGDVFRRKQHPHPFFCFLPWQQAVLLLSPRVSGCYKPLRYRFLKRLLLLALPLGLAGDRYSQPGYKEATVVVHWLAFALSALPSCSALLL